jgi:hypothetical protein
VGTRGGATADVELRTVMAVSGRLVYATYASIPQTAVLGKGTAMRLTDFLHDVGDPITFYPKFNQMFGGLTANVLINQLLYWRGKGRDPHGWIYKTHLEITEETGLSRQEQRTARAQLKERGFLIEKKEGMPAKLYFLINVEAINDAWENQEGSFNHKEDSFNQSMVASNQHDGCQQPQHGCQQPLLHTEITTEITQESTQKDSRAREKSEEAKRSGGLTWAEEYDAYVKKHMRGASQP